MATRRAAAALRGAFASQPLKRQTLSHSGKTLLCSRGQQRWSSVSQRPGSDRVNFPGAVNSLFTTDMAFKRASDADAMPTYRYLDQDGNVLSSAANDLSITDEELLKLYKDMVTISILDLIMFDAQRQGKISFYMVSAGEEGICIGSSSALHHDDPVFAQYREQGVYYQRGMTLDDFLAQCFSTKDDTGKGRNMPVHYGSHEHHVHAVSSCLATQIPQASGAAYAMKVENLRNPNKDEHRVVACYFGEGAASEGDFHAALNIAATRNCPVLFICRNNGYAISTPTLEQYKGDGIASRGVGYGVDTIRVDGNDILAMRAVTAAARELALSDNGRPVLIEAMSYRVSHHSTSDDSFAYRAKADVEEWKKRDNPITRLRKYMENKGIWDEGKEKELRSDARKAVLDSYRKAEKAKKPKLSGVLEDVYLEMTEEQKEQMGTLRSMIERYPNEYDVSEFDGGIESLRA